MTTEPGDEKPSETVLSLRQQLKAKRLYYYLKGLNPDDDKTGPDGIRESERHLFMQGAARCAGAPEPLIPPPTDNEWLQVEDIRTKHRPPDPRYGAIPAEGRFIEPKAKAAHRCPLPQEWNRPVWQCPQGHLWILDAACACRGHFERHNGRGMHMMGLAWYPATWWQRRKYGRGMKRADLSMASEDVRQELGIKPGKPPTSQSGVSPSRDGSR